MKQDYEQLVGVLAAADVEISPAEAHGLMAGWISLKGREDAVWPEVLFPDATLAKEIHTCFVETADDLVADDFSFSLCLPSLDQPIQSRAEAIVEWTQGYLAGLGLTGIDFSQNQELQEAMNDLTEVARLDVDEISESSDSESELLEVEEYVKAAALLFALSSPEGEASSS